MSGLIRDGFMRDVLCRTCIAADEKERIFEQGFGNNTVLGLFLPRKILALSGIAIRETGVPGLVHGSRSWFRKVRMALPGDRQTLPVRYRVMRIRWRARRGYSF
jgi:hypothetical protein